MRKIIIQSKNKPLPQPKSKKVVAQSLAHHKASRITFALDANLCQQAENMLQAQWTQQDYTFPSLSFLLRTSLSAYQQQEIKLTTERDKNVAKREITVRFPSDLLNFYYSLPFGRRTAILESSLRAYLAKLGTTRQKTKSKSGSG